MQHRATGATHRPTTYKIAGAIAGITEATIVDGVLRGIDDIATGATDGRIPVRMPFTVVSSIVHGIAEGMQEGELSPIEQFIESVGFRPEMAPAENCSDWYNGDS
jgi:hypothetical protein